MKPRMRSSVSVVMRPPLRRRLASLPSFTARRPKVEFGQAALAAEFGDFLQDGVVHGASLGGSFVRSLAPSEPSRHFSVNHKRSHQSCGKACGRQAICCTAWRQSPSAPLHGSCSGYGFLPTANQGVGRGGQRCATQDSVEIRAPAIAECRAFCYRTRTAVSTSLRVGPRAMPAQAPLIPLAGSDVVRARSPAFSATARDIPCPASRPISATCSSSIR